MSLQYNKSELTAHVVSMFDRKARTHPDPSLQSVEKPLDVALIHEYSHLAEATADGTQLPADQVKPRVVLISSAAATSGSMAFFVRKGRQNKDGSIQIGRSWTLEELTSLDSVPQNPRILVLGFRKPYFWVFGSLELRKDFETTLRYYYKELTGNLLAEAAPPPVPSVSRKRTVSSPRPAAGPGSPYMGGSGVTPPLAPVAPLRRAPSHESSSESLPARSPLRGNSLYGTSHQPTIRSMPSQQRMLPVPPPEVQPQPQQQSPPPPQLQPSPALESEMHAREQQYREEAARQMEQAKLEQARIEQSRIELAQREQAQREQAMHETRQEKARQEKERQEHLHLEQARQEQAKQEQARQKQARIEQARLEQARQEQARQEQARQEQVRQEQARIEQGRLEQARLEHARLEQARQDAAQNELNQPATAIAPPRSRSRPSQTSAKADRPNLKLKPQHLNKLAQEQLQQWDQPTTPVNPQFVPDFVSPGSLSPEPETRDAALRGRSRSEGLVPKLSREEGMLHDLVTLFDEFEWSENNVSELEGRIQDHLNQLSDETFLNVVDLDSQLNEIDNLIIESIKECDSVDEKMQAVALNLASAGDDIAHIRGQGDGLQITAVNYQRLATEIESLLSTLALPQSVMQSIGHPNFGEPGTSVSLTNLAVIEDLLLELYRAVKVSSFENESGAGMGSMRVLKQRGNIIGETANDFSNKFSRFVLKSVDDIAKAAGQLDGPFENSLEILFISKLYPYCGCMLFLKQTCARIYRALYQEYQRIMRAHYERQFASYNTTWAKQLDKIVGKRNSATYQATEAFGSGAPNRKSKTGDEILGVGDDSPHVALTLPGDKAQKLYKHMSSFVDQLCFHVAAQQRFLVNFFVMWEDGTQQFDTFVLQQQPLSTERLREQQKLEASLLKMSFEGIDTSESTSFAVLSVLRDKIFVKLGELASDAIKSLTKSALMESVYMAVIIDLRMHGLRKSSQQYLTSLLDRLFKLMSEVWDDMSKQQTRSILSAQYITKKRVGVLPVVSRFTEHITIVEKSITAALMNERDRGNLKSGYEADLTRETTDKTHETLFRAIAQGFQLGSTPHSSGHQTATARLKAAARETAGNAVTGEEAKALLNRHIVMIENMNKIITDLERFGSVGVQRIVLNAKQHYKKELDNYIHEVSMRPFGRLTSFLSNHDASNPSSKETVGNLKRTLSGLDAKEFRKVVEILRKRVEKHFSGAESSLLEKVWHAIGAHVLVLHQRIQRIAQQHDAMNYLEVTTAEIQSAFK